jgi:hypothetical protein
VIEGLPVRLNFFGAPPRGAVHAVFPRLSERGMMARVMVERASKILRTHCVASHLSQTSSMSGSSTATYGSFTTPVAAIRLTMNALSSAGGKVTATILQAGIG